MRAHQAIATVFGIGHARQAPGTWGSLAAILPGLIILQMAGIWGIMVATFIVFAAGLWASDKFEKETGSHDNPKIVIDEVVGMWIAMITTGGSIVWVIAAFGCFRFFDILKIWPASWVDEKIPGAWGVMGDDVIAGLYAAMAIAGVRYALGA